MEPWRILNIEPTEDVSIIKKAYAKKLRLHHPEDDPQGYQKLREAYDTALLYAKRIAENKSRQPNNTEASYNNVYEEQPAPPIIGNLYERETEYGDNTHLHHRIDLSEAQPQNLPSIEEQNAEFMLQVETLYNNFFSRIDINNWKTLLDNDVMWVIDNQRTIGKLMLDFLSSHHYLPQDIWILLDNNFHWCSRDNTVHHYYNDRFMAYIRKQIEQSKPLSYSFFKPLEGVNYEKYLEYRENAQNSFLEDDLSAADNYLEHAKEIYQDDPDLLRLEGEINMRIGDIDNAVFIFNRLLDINPADTDAISYRAVAYYESYLIRESLEDFNRAYSKIHDKNEIPLLLAKVYIKLGDMEKSKEWALKARKSASSRSEAKSLLSQIYAKLRSSLAKELEKDPSNKELKRRLEAVNSEVYKGNINGSTINLAAVIKLLKILVKIILYTVAVISCIALVFAAKLGGLILVYLLIKYLRRNKD